MTYTVFVTMKRYGFVEIEADSADEAKEMAITKALMGNDVHWTDREVDVDDTEELYELVRGRLEEYEEEE